MLTAKHIQNMAKTSRMPRGPKGEKRPADVNARAVTVGKVATGDIEDKRPTPEAGGKDPAAVALGRKGGKARAAALGKRKRKEIARKAAASRWAK